MKSYSCGCAAAAAAAVLLVFLLASFCVCTSPYDHTHKFATALAIALAVCRYRHGFQCFSPLLESVSLSLEHGRSIANSNHSADYDDVTKREKGKKSQRHVLIKQCRAGSINSRIIKTHKHLSGKLVPRSSRESVLCVICVVSNSGFSPCSILDNAAQAVNF